MEEDYYIDGQKWLLCCMLYPTYVDIRVVPWSVKPMDKSGLEKMKISMFYLSLLCLECDSEMLLEAFQ